MKNQLVVQRMGRSVLQSEEENRLENHQMVNKEYEVVPRFENPTEYLKSITLSLKRAR